MKAMAHCAFLAAAWLAALWWTEALGDDASDPWSACRFLVGEWVGDGSGQPSQVRGGFSFTPELGGKIMVRRNRAEFGSRSGQLPTIHDDMMIIYPMGPGQDLRAIYFDNEDHVITYSVHPSSDGKMLTFLSDVDSKRPRFRLTYTRNGDDRVSIAFAIAPPKGPESFKTYVEGSARRKPGSNVGSSLPRGYVTYRAAEPIAVDGKLDEPAWQAVPWTEPFQDIEGDARPRPRFQTRAKMLWDDQYFYVAAQLEEPHVWGTITKHDAVIFQDNDFEIFIDPDADNHEYYEIEINALNTEWDLFLKKPYRDGGPAVDAWEIPGLKTAVHVEGTLNDPRDLDRFWSVEFAIPWKVLGEFAHRAAPPRDGDQWRVNFSRVEWRHDVVDGKYTKVAGTKEDNWVWSPQGVIDMHRPERWGIVQFSTQTPGTVTLRADPAGPIRDRLMEVYHAQKRYHERTGRWADRVDTLELPELHPGFPRHSLSLQLTADGYQAVLALSGDNAAQGGWSIRQDSRIERMTTRP